MEKSFKELLWKQMGAGIDMLENAIKMCPEKLWDTETKFWYNAYHCLFWTDYYCTLEPDSFQPPPPFTLSEFSPRGKMPGKVYSKDELLQYLQFTREKAHALIAGLTDEIAGKRWINKKKNYSVSEIIIYNMRHVQHHAAQLNLLLRQGMNKAPGWVSQTAIPL